MEARPDTSFIQKLRGKRRTDIEAIVEGVLKWLEVRYSFDHRFGRYYVDFYLPNYAIGLECDGAYWHQNQQRDADRDAWLEDRYGLRIIRLPEAQIRAGIEGYLRRLLDL
jgi:very-short-patch-repair endonuclease